MDAEAITVPMGDLKERTMPIGRWKDAVDFSYHGRSYSRGSGNGRLWGGNMRAGFSLLVIAATSSIVFAGAKGNFYGYIKAEITSPQADCPVTLDAAGVEDVESQSTAGKAIVILAPSSSAGSYHSGSVRYDITVKTQRGGVEAVEVEWQGINAFGELQGTRKLSREWKKPLSAYATRHESETAERLTGDVSKYRVRIVRVKLSDGTMWTAPEPPPSLP